MNKNRKYAEILAELVMNKNPYEWYKKQDEETKKLVWKAFWEMGNNPVASLVMTSVLVNYFPNENPKTFKPEGIMYMDDKLQELLLYILTDSIKVDLAQSLLGVLDEINRNA